MHSRTATIAIFGVFFFESSVIGQWIPRIPDIKNALGLSDGALGLALLSMPLGTLIAFSIAGRIMESVGLRAACRLFLPVWALLFIGPALAQNLVQLAIALVISGIAVGMIETAMNTEAARIENASGKRIMSRCHGFWSLGTMVGALSGGALAQLGMSVQAHFLVMMPIIAILGFIAATALPKLDMPDAKASKSIMDATDVAAVPVAADSPSGLFRLPERAIVLLCVMPLGVMMVEGAFIDWSAVFMRDVMAAEPLLIALTYSAFSIVMAAVRFCGDSLADRFGDPTIVRLSGVAATLGISLFALAPSTPWAFLAATLSGAGAAVVFPLAVTAAANRPGRSAADNVAALNMISFSAFLVAPPIIGFLSEAFGLRIALLALTPIAFMTFLLASEVGNASNSENRCA